MPDVAYHNNSLYGHHDWLVPGLLPVGGTARIRTLLLSLHGSELFSALSTLLDRGHSLLVILFCLLARSHDFVFRQERRVIGVIMALLLRFKGREFPFCGGTSPLFSSLLCGLDLELVEQRKVGRSQDLRGRRCQCQLATVFPDMKQRTFVCAIKDSFLPSDTSVAAMDGAAVETTDLLSMSTSSSSFSSSA